MKVKKNDALPSKNKKLVENNTTFGINREVSIKLEGVTKTYPFHHEKPTFIEEFISFNRKEKFIALDNIDLTIYKGEKVGIIGINGSGKTTLLKVISRITNPTSGIINTQGSVVSLIELTAGFHLDLTGYENIFLNGLILGMSRKEINDKLPQIIDFADIGQFINSSLYTYSDGMKLRLGFSIAVHSDPDILVLDEHIGTGDLNFRNKSHKKIEEFFEKNKTILIVSHWIDYLRLHCNKIVHLDKGRVINIGDINSLDDYEKEINNL